MKTPKQYLIPLLIGVLFFLTNLLLDAPQGQITVQGKTINSSEEAVANIEIRAVRRGQTIAFTHSDENGAYSLEFDAGLPFDLAFDESDYQAAVFTSLSGNDRHEIVKVMLMQGENLNVRNRLAAEFASRYLENLD